MRWLAVAAAAIVFLPTPASGPQQAYRVEHLTALAWDDMHQSVLKMMAECVEKEPPDDVTFYAATSIVRVRDGQTMRAITDLRTNRVVLALPYVYDGKVISHEALHVLLGDDADMDTAHRCGLDPMRAVDVKEER